MIHVNVRALIIRNVDDEEEILVQRRVKENESETPIELPGGRLEEYESFIDGLRREIKEETGLALESIIDPLHEVKTTSTEGFTVECMAPYAVYQTLEGPVNSMGVYFRCRAKGKLLKKGDGSDHIQWVTKKELRRLLEEGSLSWVDQAGVQSYLNQ
ncbi:NUDIX domain-containing protein [Shouchella lonarensis]|uniref:NUDIX domain-containing protein n=1 Tax=Shouchella lonarensis TaxID=1464122 RepID=A0A1G6N913_9BACI|nr:NUDIX domain-containing protein [Shouchella lonarensis]SDC64329.1 NUDIX domain-containing protein [Shouchella lonarensis]